MSGVGRILNRIEAEGIETIRFVFADQHGVLRGKAVTARVAAGVFESGITAPSTMVLKDTSHRTAFDVWSKDAGFGEGVLTGVGDIGMKPDIETFRRLPWSPHSAWMLCDLETADGEPLQLSSRGVLQQAVTKLADSGHSMLCGFEAEFHIYRLIEPEITHAQTRIPGVAPLTAPLAQGYRLLDDATYGAMEDVLDDLRRNAEALGIPVRSAEIEFGPGQVEFTFEPGDPLAVCDQMVMFRAMARQVCQRRGLLASFMCRPAVENAASSGWHLHQSVMDQDGDSIFKLARAAKVPEKANRWIGGLLTHAAESCLLSTPTINGYKRYRPHQLAPDCIQWGHDNKGAMLRALMKVGDDSSRIENRVAESATNPYFFLAGQIHAGLSGIDRDLAAPGPVETPYDSDAEKLPDNMGEAIERFARSGFIAESFGEDFRTWLTTIKRAEWQRYLVEVSDWEQREYLTLF